MLEFARQSCIVKTLFWLIALAWSCFYGWFAVTIFLGGKKDTYLTDRQKSPADQRHWSWWLHQTFVNFAGSFTGWVAAYYLIFLRVPKAENHLIDAFFLVVALIGIFGYLPWRLFSGSIKAGDTG